ncbi:MAG: CRISPR-associated endonuclease Cas1 [Saprospiraceae bacterium]
MQLVLDTKGLELRRQGEVFKVVLNEKSNRVISPAKLTSIAVTANVLLHTDAISLAIRQKVPILFFDRIGKAKARIWSPYFESISTLRRQQVKFTEGLPATDWMLNLFWLKTQGQLYNLERLKTQRLRSVKLVKRTISQIQTNQKSLEAFRQHLPEMCRNNVMGVEGNIARLYWQALGNALPSQYSFQKRSRRPAEDIFNAAINYGYGMLYTVVEASIFSVGLDPHLGIFHTDEYTKPTLVFDMIEPFRPWVDLLIIEACLTKALDKNYFTTNQYGITFNKKGKAWLIPLFNNFLRSERKFLNRESTVKNHIHHLAGLLAKRIRVEN